MTDRYACLRALRMDLFYQNGIAKYYQQDHHYHAHVAFWLDGSKTQNTYPWAEKAGSLWNDITLQDN